MKSPSLRFVSILGSILLSALAGVIPAASGQGNVATPRYPALPGGATPKKQAAIALPSVAPALSTSSWTALGPASLTSFNSTFSGSGALVSGRITGIAPDPRNADTIYVAAAGGGVWKTSDGGQSWTPLTDTQSTLSMGAIAVAYSNSLVVYAGTGEANNSSDSNYGRGILVSTDGGMTWTLNTGPNNAFNRLTTSQIVVDPTNPNIAYAAMADVGTNGLYGSNTGIYKTKDGGQTWTNTTTPTTVAPAMGVSAADINKNPWSAVVIDPNNPMNLYAAVGYSYGAALNGVYRSTDGGNSWQILLSGGASLGRIALAIGTKDSHVLYVAIATPTDVNGSSGLYNMYRFDNADTSFAFTPLGFQEFLSPQGYYDIVIAVDPTNSANVYAAGVVQGMNMYAIIKSSDRGAHWTDITTGTNGIEPHTDNHALAFDANGNLLDGNDGGVWLYVTNFDPLEGNAPQGSWIDLNSNLNTIQFYDIGLHPTNPSIAIGGSQDNGTEVYNGNQVWTATDGGDGGFAKFSQTTGSSPDVAPGQRAYHEGPVDSFGAANFFSALMIPACIGHRKPAAYSLMPIR